MPEQTNERPGNEPGRPQFHFTPKKGWMNDPNGLVFYRGEYHLFFQHNPESTDWVNMHWGHAVSTDLFHWQELPVAIAPDRMGTIWSGSAVIDEQNVSGLKSGAESPMLAFFTAAGNTSPESHGQPFTQCMAYSVDRGRTWQRYAGNPLVTQQANSNRDPKVVYNGLLRRWLMVFYLERDEFALYSSENLTHWEHVQNLTMPGCDECPDLFEMTVEFEGTRKWVFTAANGKYMIGRFDGPVFVPESGPHVSDEGANFYAVQTFSGLPDGRRVQIAWMRGGQFPNLPFSQQMGLPCDLKLRHGPNGLYMTRYPVPELARLHGRVERAGRAAIVSGSPHVLPAPAPLLDIDLELAVAPGGSVTVSVCGETVHYDSTTGRLSHRDTSTALPRAETTRLRIVRDRTSLEVFGGEGDASLSNCIHPSGGRPEIAIASEGAGVTLVSTTIAEVKSARA